MSFTEDLKKCIKLLASAGEGYDDEGYDTLYHTASPLVRQEILDRGLLPGLEASYGPPAVYLWKDMDLASRYYWVDDQELLDVWEVDADGLTVEDDPEDPVAAVYTLDKISRDRLRLIGTFMDGELIPPMRVSELLQKGHPTKPLRKVMAFIMGAADSSHDEEGEALEIDGHKVHIHKEKAKYSRESLSPKQTVYVITDDVSGDIITDPATTKRSAIEQARRALALIYAAKDPISGAAEDDMDPISLGNIGEGYFTDEEIGRFLQKQGAKQLIVMGKTFPDYWILDDKIIDWDGDNVYPTVESCEEFLSDAPSIIDDVAAILEHQSVKEMAEYPPSEVYHATLDVNVDDILEDGLRPMNTSRGFTNRNVGHAVFTTMNKDSAFSGTYGDSVFSINIAQMKADGVLPVMTSEPSVYEYEAYGVLAHALGLDSFDAPIESDGADDPDTVIIHGAIPPKYLKLLDNE